MLGSSPFSAALWSFCLSFDLINFFYVAVRSFRFPQKYPIIYATAIFFISPSPLSTVDNVTFFMIQLIIFGLDSFICIWVDEISACQMRSRQHQPKEGSEIFVKGKRIWASLFLCCISNGIIASLIPENFSFFMLR